MEAKALELIKQWRQYDRAADWDFFKELEEAILELMPAPCTIYIPYDGEPAEPATEEPFIDYEALLKETIEKAEPCAGVPKRVAAIIAIRKLSKRPDVAEYLKESSDFHIQGYITLSDAITIVDKFLKD